MILEMLFQIIGIIGLSTIYFVEQIMFLNTLECSIFTIWFSMLCILDDSKYIYMFISMLCILMYTYYYYDNGNVFYN